eukprot:GFUD01069329.1.p1 GENE.GFUD01069329.1~~GFUD01069329.1.p1  ORF type:complete len:673 (+),score=125.66 GFUD01069329.1:195-2213(+)
MGEECLEKNLLDHSGDNHDEIPCVGEGSTYTNCSFVINNEFEANNNSKSSNNSNNNRIETEILPKTPHSCVRFKGVCDATPGGTLPTLQTLPTLPPDLALISDKSPVKFELGDSSGSLQPGSSLYLRNSERTFSTGSRSSIPKRMVRQRNNTFSNCQYSPIKEPCEIKESHALMPARTRLQTYSEESHLRTISGTRRSTPGQTQNINSNVTKNPLELALSLPISSDFPETDFSFRGGAYTAPVQTEVGDSRRTFSFGGSMANRFQRRVTRQMTISGDSTSSIGNHKSMNRILNRALSRTFTVNSIADGSNSTIVFEEWKPIFDKFDLEADGRQDGKIPLDKFAAILDGDPVWKESVPQTLKDRIIKEVDLNNDGVIDYHEFLTLVKGKNLGLGQKRRRAFRQLLKETVEFLVPYKYTYQNQYSCSPPPLFMLLISLVQIAIFMFNSFQQIGDIGLHGPVPYCSYLIYNPNRKSEVWRYLTYSLVHSGLFHVSFNILVQLVLGIPLEMVHGAWRVGAVYLSGIFAGSLWTSVLKPGVFLSGASGGVYALIMGHLGTVIMNHREMSYPWWRVAVVSITAITDVGVYVYETAVLGQPAKPISYPAHIAGALAGLLIGVVCLRNLSWEKHQRYIWIISLFIYAVLIFVAIVWNCLDSNTPLNAHLKLDTDCPHFIA